LPLALAKKCASREARERLLQKHLGDLQKPQRGDNAKNSSLDT
jgi:hypothetical protein